MISFDQFTLREGIPIYLQIVRHIKRGIVAGSIQNDDEMPSRRVLSALLGVNPNTVQKAYRVLEEERIISSRAGAKSCVSLQPGQAEALRAELLEGDARDAIASLRQMGITKAEASALLDRLWEDSPGKEALP